MTTFAVGNYSLAVSVLAAGVGILAAIASVRFDSSRLLRASRAAIYGVAGLLTVACAALTIAIVSNDFRLDYVVSYSERALPMGYKLAAFWAGQEGSMLLWAWLLAIMASIAAIARRKDPTSHQAPALAILSAACGFFAVLMLFAANPFRLGEVVPADGRGLNPMLQDPAMIAHPPLLFLGYAGFAIPFAFTFGALIAGRSDNLWIPSVRRWVLGAWLFLTAGIVLGAEWAYVELGWGGYWAWDPVENASLLPWFTATALLHSLIAQQRRGMLKVWNAALVAMSFILCIFGSYLTRSGVIASVHAFPESPVGQFFLAMLLASLAVSVGVILWRRKLLKSEHRLERLLSREGAFLAANVLLVVMMLTTLIGTIFPLISKPFMHQPMSLGPEFYTAVVVPMSLALAALMGAGPLLAFASSAGRLGRKLIVPGAAAVVAGVAGLVLSGSGWVLLCAAISAFVVFGIGADIAGTIRRQFGSRDRGVLAAIGRLFRVHSRRYGGQLVHLGVVMMLVGVAGSSLYGIKKEWKMRFGESARIGRYRLRLESLKEVREANYAAGEAEITLFCPDGSQTVLRPQRRRYNKSPQFNTEVAIHSNLREDVYLTVAGWGDRGKIVVIQALVNPLVSWIWIGGIAMGVGTIVCLLPRRAERDRGAEARSARAVEVRQGRSASRGRKEVPLARRVAHSTAEKFR